MNYLQKRHPLYFVPTQINKDQITDLLNRLIYRLKQKEELQSSSKKIENDPEPVFKAGNALPAVADHDEAKNQNLQNKAKQMFDDLEDYEDEFEDSAGQKENENFDANELLNFTDYQNKRREATNSGNLNIKDVLSGKAAQTQNPKYDDQIDIADDWGDEWEESEEDIDGVDYAKANLNKLDDKTLAKHKQAMEKGFSANQLKPGDAGFTYDKRIEFTKAEPGELDDDSWDESGDEEKKQQMEGEEDDSEMDYFDDDFN